VVLVTVVEVVEVVVVLVPAATVSVNCCAVGAVLEADTTRAGPGRLAFTVLMASRVELAAVAKAA